MLEMMIVRYSLGGASKKVQVMQATQRRAKERVFAMNAGGESRAILAKLRALSRSYPSPASIFPQHKPQRLWLLHRLVYHLLLPFNPDQQENPSALNVFDLSGLGIYLEAGHIVAADWENFRWAEWLLWLSGQRHAAGGVARMSEEGEETGTVTRTLFKDLGLEFNHLCLTDSKVFIAPAHLFAFMSQDYCYCKPLSSGQFGANTRPASILPIPYIIKAHHPPKHIHRETRYRPSLFGFSTSVKAKADITIYPQYDTQPTGSTGLFSPATEQVLVTPRSFDQSQPELLGPLSLVDTIVRKLRSEISALPLAYNQDIPAAEIARYLELSSHIAEAGYTRQEKRSKNALCTRLDLSPEAHQNPAFVATSALSRLPVALLEAVQHSYECEWCHLFVGCREPARAHRDVLLWVEDIQGADEWTGINGDMEETVISARLCPRCMLAGQRSKEIPLAASRPGGGWQIPPGCSIFPAQ